MISALFGPLGVAGAFFAGSFALAFACVAAVLSAPPDPARQGPDAIERAELLRRRLILTALSEVPEEALPLDAVLARVQALSWQHGVAGSGSLVSAFFGLVSEGLVEESGEETVAGRAGDLSRTHYRLTPAARGRAAS